MHPPSWKVSNMLLGRAKGKIIALERMKRLVQSRNDTQFWMCLVVKVRCCTEQYCIGTWNVRSINQGKLEVIKQVMARVNIDILGISKLKWTGNG